MSLTYSKVSVDKLCSCRSKPRCGGSQNSAVRIIACGARLAAWAPDSEQVGGSGSDDEQQGQQHGARVRRAEGSGGGSGG